MRFLLTSRILEQEDSSRLSDSVHSYSAGPLHLLTDDLDCIKETDSHVFINQGFINDLNLERNDSRDQLNSVIKNVSQFWPVPQNITGSFSSVLFEKKDSQIIICNDLIGIYPLYYLSLKGHFYISNNLSWIGSISTCEFDEVGIFQTCFTPESSTIGSRTIIKSCKRLLPGEWLKFDMAGKKIGNRYDSSLYQELTRDGKDLPKKYWDDFKKELSYCLSHHSKVNIALSGGLDSRILFGAIPEAKKISCYTYGAEDNYETKIAASIANLRGAKFNSFNNPWLNFPPLNLLREYTSETEAVYLCSWLEILENVNPEAKEAFLLGDLSTAISGRTINRFSSKIYQQKNFVKHSILGKNYELTSFSKDSFENWKREIEKKFLRSVNHTNLHLLNISVSEQEMLSAIRNDLKELFARIESHNLQYIELADELFTWYTHTRVPMGKQVLINNRKFEAYCPALSMGILRSASNVHPNLRLNQRFIKRLFREIPELNHLAKMPTSQVPLIPQNFPDIIRFPVWALRSKIDNYLIKKMVQTKDSSRRYRLFKSNNWSAIYQNPFLEERLDSYFAIDHLGSKFTEGVKKRVINRKNLVDWPFANMDIMNVAALNTEMDLIISGKRNEI